VIRQDDFHPSKTKLLETAVDGDGKGQSTILKIK